MTKLGFIMVPGLLFLVSCGGKEAEKEKPLSPKQQAALVYGKPAPPELQEGQKIWMDTCNECHGTGLGGAPYIGNKEQWAPRVAKGMDTLFKHAIEGFYDDGEMPERGGNEDLTDDQVKAAVKYMVSVSK